MSVTVNCLFIVIVSKVEKHINFTKNEYYIIQNNLPFYL